MGRGPLSEWGVSSKLEKQAESNDGLAFFGCAAYEVEGAEGIMREHPTLPVIVCEECSETFRILESGTRGKRKDAMQCPLLSPAKDNKASNQAVVLQTWITGHGSGIGRLNFSPKSANAEGNGLKASPVC
jgi:hypothetical protein